MSACESLVGTCADPTTLTIKLIFHPLAIYIKHRFNLNLCKGGAAWAGGRGAGALAGAGRGRRRGR